MRLFTGLDLAPDIVERIRELVGRLRPLADIRWSPIENLHITTKFIGEFPAGRLDELKDRLRLSADAVPVTVKGLGFYPRIFWAGIERSPELLSLASATEAAVEELGVKREERAYSPHLTLARFANPKSLGGLRKASASVEQDFGSFVAREFYLYESRASVYTKIARFPIG